MQANRNHLGVQDHTCCPSLVSRQACGQGQHLSIPESKHTMGTVQDLCEWSVHVHTLRRYATVTLRSPKVHVLFPAPTLPTLPLDLLLILGDASRSSLCYKPQYQHVPGFPNPPVDSCLHRGLPTYLQVRPRRQVAKERPTRAMAEARKLLTPDPGIPALLWGDGRHLAWAL